ncbi:hypothetical protein At1D1108_50880 (plasmid) [Agrobacterium tumefaciens]|nr:hypothetical protein At1D1108_50880 [Agrobacterium tumefaciens]
MSDRSRLEKNSSWFAAIKATDSVSATVKMVLGIVAFCLVFSTFFWWVGQ